MLNFNAYQTICDPRGVTCLCRDAGMCHYFGYFFGVLQDFWVSFRSFPDFWVSFFLVKFIV